MGKLNIQFAPVEDAGTGEVSQSLDPITHSADDVANQPVSDAADLPESTTHTADAVTVESTFDGDEATPVTTAADWPPHGEDKTVSADASEAKSTPAKKAPARKAAATESKGA